MFNFNNFERQFSPGQLYIHDGAWIGSIALILILMIFNDVSWSLVGMNLIYILMALHVLAQHRNLYGDRDIWGKRLFMFGAWILSIFLVAVMPVVALINYGICARDIKRRFSAKEYKMAWTAYMRIIGLCGLALLVYAYKVYAVAGGVPPGAEQGAFL